jgi:DNA helicase IV
VPHPDVPGEQAHLDAARAALAAMRARTGKVLEVAELAATEVDSEVARWHLGRRLASIDDDGPALCFGRIDEDRGDRWYVGRRHVEDPDGVPMVVDWRAPVSTPFYRATVQDPQGLALRRRFVVDGPALVDILEEDFDDPDGALLAGGVPDPLLAELERSRGPEMRDIVATIAAEQDEVIRAPLDRCLVVQGGPGTGKTAVALHRAAYLLYEHRAVLQEKRVLVLGPNPVFLRYVAGVLPSLGETAVLQTTLEGLVAARWPVTRTDRPAAAALRGDARMSEVLHRVIDERIRPPSEPVLLATPWGRARLPVEEVAAIIGEIRERRVPHAVGREAFRSQVLHLAYEIHERTSSVPALKARFTADARADKGVQRELERIWPTQRTTEVVRRAGNRTVLRRVAADLLDRSEIDLLVERGDGWSRADVALLDQADALLAGSRATYGHVVVDEAQDLSAMDLRMAARRASGGSMTIVGDLAQATSPGSQTSWSAAVRVLEPAVPAQLEELTVGYRLPGPILELANRLLDVAAPGVRPSRSVRPTGDPPVDLVLADVVPGIVGEAGRLAERFGSVAVIAPAALHPALAVAFDEAGVQWADARRAGLGEQVTLLDPVGAKGLEFDAVVVGEPAAVASSGDRGLQSLFVALTRAVQHLSIVRTSPLPDSLVT